MSGAVTRYCLRCANNHDEVNWNADYGSAPDPYCWYCGTEGTSFMSGLPALSAFPSLFDRLESETTVG